MNTMEQQYLVLLDDILKNGEERIDRTKVGTLSVFGRQLRCNLADGFPALTTKKLAWKAMVAELLWFLEGSNDERRLCELTHGSRDLNYSTIWTLNAQADYWKPKAKFDGDLGNIYGVQWRSWPKSDGTCIDQIKKAVDSIRHNPTDRRILVSAYNVGELENMALPPCHMFFQFYVNQKNKTLSCQMYQRSVDCFLGLPLNIASYALLTHMIAQVTGLTVGELIITLGDTHIYKNHIEQVKEQLSRTTFAMPSLLLDTAINDIDDFKMHHISLENYQHHPSIKAPMAQ